MANTRAENNPTSSKCPKSSRRFDARLNVEGLRRLSIISRMCNCRLMRTALRQYHVRPFLCSHFPCAAGGQRSLSALFMAIEVNSYRPRLPWPLATHIKF
eukprot:5300293-Alexandrium_andersonii.AAC.1